MPIEDIVLLEPLSSRRNNVNIAKIKCAIDEVYRKTIDEILVKNNVLRWTSRFAKAVTSNPVDPEDRMVPSSTEI
ncbi:hypothetical protein TNCV_4192761 [Trichonephila clavipes]|nr:hypothetical protein TNCV_4192761 [Trichonephila clavipes]